MADKTSKPEPRKMYKEKTADDFFDFDRIQKQNNATRRPRERAPVDNDRKKEYEEIKKNLQPRRKPFRENSSEEFLKFGGHQRRVNHNGTRKPTSDVL